MEHLIVDCATAEERRVPLTPEEIAQREAGAAAEKASGERRAADLAMIREQAKTDPAFAALARHLGLT